MDQETISRAALELRLGVSLSVQAIYHGDWAAVYRLQTDQGLDIAVKCPAPGHQWLAAAEMQMLEFLGHCNAAPVPEVLGLASDMLFLSFVENDGQRTSRAQSQAGRHLARLHTVTSSQIGFRTDTIFGPSVQPNGWHQDWICFFGEQRLRHMAGIALAAGRIQPATMRRLEKLIDQLSEVLPPLAEASLLHGDFWGGNVLYNQGECVAFIDPAIYFGHPEVDLAFATLFGSFSAPFFDGYGELRPLEPGFKERIDIYNLWPLLFHAYWFGGGYAQQVDSILKSRGF